MRSAVCAVRADVLPIICIMRAIPVIPAISAGVQEVIAILFIRGLVRLRPATAADASRRRHAAAAPAMPV